MPVNLEGYCAHPPHWRFSQKRQVSTGRSWREVGPRYPDLSVHVLRRTLVGLSLPWVFLATVFVFFYVGVNFYLSCLVFPARTQ
jgi:hypothetical protein